MSRAPDDAGGDARPAAARRARKADVFLGRPASDFQALERLCRLAFTERVPKPNQRELFPVEAGEDAGDPDEDAS